MTLVTFLSNRDVQIKNLASASLTVLKASFYCNANVIQIVQSSARAK